MSGGIGAATQPSLQTILYAYAYKQYTDDPNVVAFFKTYTAFAQSYLNWFNGSPLAVYTSGGITGSLLDWCATGIYGIPRPIISSLSTSFRAGVATHSVGAVGVGVGQFAQSGTASPADDDIYKRVLTWWLYRGDGQQMSIPWLRRRVARFIYGANGSDVSVAELPNIGITVSSSAIAITVPAGTSSSFFKQCADNGDLAFPFMTPITVTVG